MQTDPDDWEAQLLELAQTTERVADAVGNRAIADRGPAAGDRRRSLVHGTTTRVGAKGARVVRHRWVSLRSTRRSSMNSRTRKTLQSAKTG